LNESSKPADFTELGFWGGALGSLKGAIVQPHGMVLVTGPTGSGKSTTLFSVLSSLNSPNVNISTVEDPVEYHIVGANQTQVNPIAGMTFTNGLRALLRQDPNIIMVGEVRDGETQALSDGIGKTNPGKNGDTDEMSTSATAITRLWKAHDEGCDSCNHTGYKGRVGIYEVLDNSPGIQKMIVTNSTSESIETQAIDDGMLTMQLDGLIKSLRGQTTVEEVLRVTAQE
jgi:type II secretory ATPase GspE/PulE/Tfp pilus assembly ATPase PilB-like protein